MGSRKSSRTSGAKPYPKSVLYRKARQRSFSGTALDQVAFPLGGIGAGQVNLGGSGQLQDFSIFNKPALGEQPRGCATVFARPRGGDAVARVIQGPVTHSRVFAGGRHAGGGAFPDGYPRMKKAAFRGEFPFATVDFSDPSLPLKVSLEAFSPFIPLDVKNSALPAAVLKYTFRNPGTKPIDAQFVYSMQNPFLRLEHGWWPVRDGCVNRERGSGRMTALEYSNEILPEADPRKGTFAVAVLEPRATVQETWYPGPCPSFILWKEISNGRIVARKMPPKPSDPGKSPFWAEGGSIAVSFTLKPGETRTIPLIIAWHVPNAGDHHDVPKEDIEKWEQQTGKKAEEAPATACCDTSCGCDGGAAPNPIKWRPYYAKFFNSAFDVAQYVADDLDGLEKRTRRFHNLLFGSTFPSVVLDAVSANLGILKSPTCLLMDNGQFWAYEGCHCAGGCCHGSCTHVWNYAQAMPHLFPQLERTLRTLELEHSMDDKGHVQFRARLPLGPAPHTFHAASDGQLGGIMKVWREWQISGDDDWLRRMYPLARRSLDWCIETWDPGHRGALFEAHHNTYDIEFWGPDGMCTSFYLGALRAMADMATYLGHAREVGNYTQLAEKGLKFVNSVLFNGEYYFQKIQWKGLRTNLFDIPHWKEREGEERRLTEKEGPPFQYGKGCLSDGVIGQWFTELFGLPDALDRAKTRKHLESVFRHNFRRNLSEHSNPQRPTYALNDEAGLLLCTWPKGRQLSIPFFYAPEVWTGIEYQVASHMVLHGMVDEALTIVQAVRDRYEGFKRNPWNEYECGSYYARALAVYGVFTALSGFRYSAVTQKLELDPRLPDRKLVTFFSTDKAWGRITLSCTGKTQTVTIEVEEGALPVKSLVIGPGKGGRQARRREVALPGKEVVRPGRPLTVRIS